MANKRKKVADLPQISIAVEPVEQVVVTPEPVAQPEIVEINSGFLISGGANTEYLVGERSPSPLEWPEQPPQDNDHIADGSERFPEPALAAFAVSAEAQAVAMGVTVCQITHPDAIDGAIHEGANSGIRLVKGDDVYALLSDGSTI